MDDTKQQATLAFCVQLSSQGLFHAVLYAQSTNIIDDSHIQMNNYKAHAVGDTGPA